MMENEPTPVQETKKCKCRPILLIVVTFIISGLLVGGGVYFWQQSQASKGTDECPETKKCNCEDVKESTSSAASDCSSVESECQTDKDALQSQINTLKAQLAAASSDDLSSKLPAIIHLVAFSDAEKSEIKKKVTDPFFDYYNEDEIQYIAMSIEKHDDRADDDICKYTALAISTIQVDGEGAYESWCIERENGQFLFWIPTCMDACSFSEAYKAKYPEVVQRAGGN